MKEKRERKTTKDVQRRREQKKRVKRYTERLPLYLKLIKISQSLSVCPYLRGVLLIKYNIYTYV